MKKRLSIVTALVLVSSMLVACGGMNPDKYVTLGNYEGIDVEVSYVTFTEEEVETSVNAELDAYVEAYDLYDYSVSDETTVSQGSIVNIDYVGTLNGEAFSGGTAEGAHLEIGSGGFIDGFEDGLVGKTVGETVDLNLTFPEEYHSPEMAGKDVVFTVSINSIDLREKPTYDDEFVASLQLDASITSYETMKDYIRDYMQSSCDEQNELALQEAVWTAVYGTCEVSEPPQELVDEKKIAAGEYYEKYAEAYGMDLETFISNMGMDMTTYEEELSTIAVEDAKMELVYMAIAKKEGIKVDDKLVKATAEEEYAMYGYESAEALIEDMGEGEYEAYVLRKEVLEKLSEIVNVVEAEPISLIGE